MAQVVPTRGRNKILEHAPFWFFFNCKFMTHGVLPISIHLADFSKFDPIADGMPSNRLNRSALSSLLLPQLSQR